MILPGDPILYLIVVAGVFVFYACKGCGEKQVPPSKTADGQDFGEWFANLQKQNKKRNEERLDELRYQKWLIEHQ